MFKEKNIFLKDSVIAFDVKHRKTILYNISKYNESVERGKLRYRDMELAKKRASYIKQKVRSDLAGYLQEFEKNAQKNGIEIIWARSPEEAVQGILEILEKNNARVLVKSKSMISEEIGLNEHIQKTGTEPVETDLGEFIVQTAGEKPYHILTPAMHKSKKDVAELFNKKFQTPPNSTPEELTLFVRQLLRKKFTSAEVGVTGANFLIADTGSVALTENEGNGLMSVSFPRIHIVISGIEKLLPSFSDLSLFVPLLAALGTGQQVTVYNSVISGSRKKEESNGPDQMIVVLLDHKRSEIARENKISEILKCIRCGACLNACPIYKNVGGYTYHTTYTGPVGSVISPYMEGFDKYNHLSFACTVCGACTEVCPVKIPLHTLLLENRKKSVEHNFQSLSWNLGMKTYGYAFGKRKILDQIPGKLKNKILLLNRNILGKEKEFPRFAKLSYSQIRKLNLK